MLTTLALTLLTCDGVMLSLVNGDFLCCDAVWQANEQVYATIGDDLFIHPLSLVASWDVGGPQQESSERASLWSQITTSHTPGGAKMLDKLDVRDVSLIDLIRFLAEKGGYQLVIDASVQDQQVTYMLHQIPVAAALQMVLRNAGLDYEMQDVVVVARPMNHD